MKHRLLSTAAALLLGWPLAVHAQGAAEPASLLEPRAAPLPAPIPLDAAPDADAPARPSPLPAPVPLTAAPGAEEPAPVGGVVKAESLPPPAPRPVPAPVAAADNPDAPISLAAPSVPAQAGSRPPLATRSAPPALWEPKDAARPVPLASAPAGTPVPFVPAPWVPQTPDARPIPFSPDAAPAPAGKKMAAVPRGSARLPDDGLPADASPAEYLRAARSALVAGRAGEARSALEMAQTRLLTRDVDQGQERFPSRDTAVRQISAAISALAADDRIAGLDHIEAASQSIGAPAGRNVSN